MDVFYIGIDSGRNGALAALDAPGCLLGLHDLPDLVPTGRLYCHRAGQALRQILDEYAARAKLCIAVESPIAMPGMNVVAVHNKAMSYGALDCILADYATEPNLLHVIPTVWQNSHWGRQLNTDKRLSMEFAALNFPRAELVSPRGRRLDGRADALLIALWNLRSGKETKHDTR
jgi:hypothetical protein